MSYEVWGDDDDGLDGVRDSLVDAGWLTSEDADDLRADLFAASWTRMVFLACVMIPGHPMHTTLALHDASSALARLTSAKARAHEYDIANTLPGGTT